MLHEETIFVNDVSPIWSLELGGVELILGVQIFEEILEEGPKKY